MKVFVLALLVVIVLGGLVGTLLVADAGYVLVSYGSYVLETSLWVLLFGLLFGYLLLRSVIYLFRKSVQGQMGLSRWRTNRRLGSARSQTVRGLLVMSEGRWADAEKLLLASAQQVETPLINYLNAARAAHELGEYHKRDEYLRLAHETTPGAKFAVTITQAEFNIRQGHFEQALAALLMLRKRAPKHGAVLAMLAKCYENLADWHALHETLPSIIKQKALPTSEITRLERVSWQALLQGDMAVNKAWKRFPKHLRGEEGLLVEWVDHLVLAGRQDDAEEVIRLATNEAWHETLVKRYGQIQASDTARQLIVAQNWAKDKPQEANLSLTLGRLCLVNEKFEQAREYFETSLRLQPGDEVYAELGRLCVALGDERRGTEYLLKSLGALADLPQPVTQAIRKVGVT